MAAGHTISNISYHTFFCSATPRRKRKLPQNAIFSPKAHKTGTAAHIDKIAAQSVQCRYPNRYGGQTMQQCMDADNLHRRLKKIIGQVQAIDRMVDEDVPCEDIFLRRSMRPNPRCTAAARSFSRGTSSTACATASSTATRTKRSRALRRRSSAFRTWAEQEINPLTRPFSVELHERREAVLCCFSLFARFITYTPICIISPYPLWYRKESLP